MECTGRLSTELTWWVLDEDDEGNGRRGSTNSRKASRPWCPLRRGRRGTMSRPERPAPHRFTHRMKMFENTLLVGSKVRLRNLQSRADLNGYIGTVIEILDTPECCEECMEPVGYAVELTPTAKGMEIIKVKRVFLEVVEKPSVLFIEGYHGENFLSTGWMGDELLSHQAWRRYFNVTRSSCVTTTSYGTVTIDLDSISTKQIYSGLYHAIVVVDFSGHHELFRRTYGECLRDLVNYGGKIAFLTSETQGKPSQIAETLKMTFNTKWERSGCVPLFEFSLTSLSPRPTPRR